MREIKQNFKEEMQIRNEHRIVSNFMKLKIILILLAAIFSSQLSQALIVTNSLYGYVQTFGLSPTTNTLELDLISPVNRTLNGINISNDPQFARQDTNGYFCFSNIIWGKYKLLANDGSGTEWSFNVYTNTTGAIPIASLIGSAAALPPNPATNYYTMPQVDALLANVSSSGTSTNVAFATSAAYASYSTNAGTANLIISGNGGVFSYDGTNWLHDGWLAADYATTARSVNGGTAILTGITISTNLNETAAFAVDTSGRILAKEASWHSRDDGSQSLDMLYGGVRYLNTVGSGVTSVHADGPWTMTNSENLLGGNGALITGIASSNVTGLGTAATVNTNTLLTWNTNAANAAAAAALQQGTNSFQPTNANLSAFASVAITSLITNGSIYRPPVTGCIMWCDPSALTATNGQPVNVFTDISGNNNHLYPAYDSSPYATAAPTNKPIFSDTGINGAPALGLLANWGADGTYPSRAYGLSNLCWTASMSNTFTLTMVFRDMREDGTATANSFLFMFGTNSAAPLIQPHLATSTYSNGPTVFGNLQSWGGTQLFFNPQERTYPNVFTLRMNAGQGDLWVNGFLVASNVTYQSGGPIGSLFSIGMKWLHNYAIYQSHLGSFNGYLGDVVLSTNAEPATELLALQNHLMRKYKIALNPQVVFFGDSITEGIYARPRSNFVCVAHAMVAGVDFYNQAIPGITASNLIQMQTNWLGCTKDSAIIVTLWGANDMFRGHSFASLTTNTLLSAQYIRSQGRKAVFCTMPSLLWETGYTITRSNYNNWLVANSNLFDGLIRYDLDPDIGYTGAYTNEFLIVQTNSIPSADKVHPTGDAYRLLFTRWTWPAIKQMLQPNVIGDSFTGTFTGNGSGLTNLAIPLVKATFVNMAFPSGLQYVPDGSYNGTVTSAILANSCPGAYQQVSSCNLSWRDNTALGVGTNTTFVLVVNGIPNWTTALTIIGTASAQLIATNFVFSPVTFGGGTNVVCIGVSNSAATGAGKYATVNFR